MALDFSATPSDSANSASNMLTFHLPAKSLSAPSVVWPMPRLGVVTARRKAGSSSSLTIRRSQAHRSLISARSKKLWPPDTLYGICARAQLLLEHARLVVGAVQDREVGELHARVVAAQRLDARDGALGLVLLAVALHHLHRLAVAQVAPELLLEDLRVERDHLVGRAQDRAGGAVVLLQRDHLERRVLGRQALEVVDGGAAPAVDATGRRRPRP